MTLTAFMRGLLVPVVVDASMYLNVVPSDLEVQISGGTERLVSSLDGQMIHVDAHTMSSDPSMEDPGEEVCTESGNIDPFQLISSVCTNMSAARGLQLQHHLNKLPLVFRSQTSVASVRNRLQNHFYPTAFNGCTGIVSPIASIWAGDRGWEVCQRAWKILSGLYLGNH